MKLRNKKTGEIVIFGEGIVDLNRIGCKNVAEMMGAGWEDYEESKDYWYLNCDGDVIRAVYKSNDLERSLIAIGNYFESPEEAEKAVKKLEAWKRLKDKGFRFNGYGHYDDSGDEAPYIAFEYPDLDEMFYNKQVVADLDLLFGGEE